MRFFILIRVHAPVQLRPEVVDEPFAKIALLSAKPFHLQIKLLLLLFAIVLYSQDDSQNGKGAGSFSQSHLFALSWDFECCPRSFPPEAKKIITL